MKIGKRLRLKVIYAAEKQCKENEKDIIGLHRSQISTLAIRYISLIYCIMFCVSRCNGIWLH